MQTKPFIVYKSSAGSGKTYTLVKEYLKIVLENPTRIRNILAITFTNAAAAEMKERIIAALGDLSMLAGKNEDQWPTKSRQLLEAILKESSLPKSEIIRNAQVALTLILHNYGEFSVSTIDSFAHRIIRSFAFDLHLPLNFDVELDQDQLLSQAIDLLISRAGKEPILTSLLVEYIESRTDEERSHYIEYDMARLAKTLMDEKGTLYVDRLKDLTLEDFSNIHGKLSAGIRKFEEQVRQIARQACELMDQYQVPTEMFYQGNKGIGMYFKRLVHEPVIKFIQPNTLVVKTIEEDKWQGGKATPDIKSAIEAISGRLRDLYEQITRLTTEQFAVYKIFMLVKKHLFPMAVLCELERVIDDIKSENAMLHISDFNKKISEIVAVESAPFIYERIGERYHHYMIDEFQDTSGLQWQNLLPLIDNSLASGHTNLVVGDGKQAIYRWRNGDVEQFASLPLLPESIIAQNRLLWQQTLERTYQPFPLDTNWRSLPQIIDFNNDFFRFAKQFLPGDLLPIYDGHEQKKHPSKTGGYVQIDFLSTLPDREMDYTGHTHERILETITELREKNHPLNDITILCRSNREASAIARFLLENGLSVISSESLLLSQSAKVNFILAVMKLINHSEDEISLTEMLQYLVKSGNLGEDLHTLLMQLKRPDHGNQRAKLSLEKLEEFLHQQGIPFAIRQARHLGIYELGEKIIQGFFPGHPADPFIAFFMDVLYDYNNRFVSSLPDFLEYWSENSGKFSVVVPEGIEAVQIMTIHKSKGLQFPVVICPFADKDFGRLGKEGEWVELPEMEETQPLTIAWLSLSQAMEGTPYEPLWTREKGKTLLDILNVSYVAFTRAVDKLFVFTRYPDSGKFSDKNMAGLLHLFLAGQNLWQESQTSYPFGENKPALLTHGAQDMETEKTDLFGEYVSKPWADRIAIRSRQAELQTDQTTPSGRGSLIHEIMEQIYTREDVERVLDQYYNRGVTDRQQAEIIREKIIGIVCHPLLEKYYSKEVKGKNESGMYDDHGQYFRADRVILSEDSAVVIDYKTGGSHPSHPSQLINYGNIIRKMGYREVVLYLAYLDEGKVESV